VVYSLLGYVITDCVCIWVKSVYDKIVIENLKKRKNGSERNVYWNLHLK